MSKHTVESLQALVKSLRTERNNFRAMYENAKDRKEIQRLQKKAGEQAKTIETQNEIIILLQEQNEILKLRVDELERMVFGKHKRRDKDPPDGGGLGFAPGTDTDAKVRNAPKRPPFSYRRKTPEAMDVTHSETHILSECPDCQSELSRMKTIERFLEDIPSLGEIQALLHRVTKHTIETGYCPCCKKRKTAVPISSQTVSLGENVRRFVCYSSVIQRQSYDQIRQFLTDMAGIAVSDGEIANMLENEKMKLVPEYETMKARLQNEAVVHYDETSWRVAKEEQ